MRHVSDRIAVVYLGRIVELRDKRTLFLQPLHPYTEALLSAAPVPDPEKKKSPRVVVRGEVPSAVQPPTGCHFHTRCPYVLPASAQRIRRSSRSRPGITSRASAGLPAAIRGR
jgi:oligopeptide transport system ATP-binding protein